MIHYRNKDAAIWLVLRKQGSIFPRSILPATFSACICLLFASGNPQTATGRQEVSASFFGLQTSFTIKHPFAVQIFAIILGYVCVFRTTMALSRYQEGLSHTQLMTSKWCDAFMQLKAFCSAARAKETVDKRKTQLDVLTQTLLHLFTLLDALAVCALNAEEGKDGRPVNPLEKLSIQPMPMIYSGMLGRKSRKPLSKVLKAADITYDVIGELSREEQARLEKAIDLPCVVADWIMEAVTRAQLKGLLTVPPPIISRFYQELSNGLVGFSQAYKVTSTPFPFPFAQILALLLSVFCVVCPIIVVQMTSGYILPPILSFSAILSYWGLNQIAVELENPFGDDDNDLPLVDMHRFFVDAVEEAYIAQPRQNIWSAPSEEEAKPVDRGLDKAVVELHEMCLEQWGVKERFSPMVTLDHLAEFTVDDLEQKFNSVDVAIALRAEIERLVEERDDEMDQDDVENVRMSH